MVASVAASCCYAASCPCFKIEHYRRLPYTFYAAMLFFKRGCVLERFLLFYGEGGQGNSIILDQICLFTSTVSVCLVGVSRPTGWRWCIWLVPLVIFEFFFFSHDSLKYCNIFCSNKSCLYMTHIMFT